MRFQIFFDAEEFLLFGLQGFEQSSSEDSIPCLGVGAADI